MNYGSKRPGASLVKTLLLFAVFVIYTVTVMRVDVQPIGPAQSSVGCATVNGFVRDLVGTSDFFYLITKILLLIAFAFVGLFGLVGLWQLLKRKSLFAVDTDILCLGGFYVLIAVAYAVFEILSLNFRPVILDEGLEASYPSTHVFVIVCVLGSAMIQIQRKVWNLGLKKIIQIVMGILIVMAVVGRMLSGVHWFTDIIGGCLLSAAMITLYNTVILFFDKRK